MSDAMPSANALKLKGSVGRISRILCLVLVGLSGLAYLALPKVCPPDCGVDPWRRDYHHNVLQQIFVALHKYKEEHGYYPSAVMYYGKQRVPYSWRVALLPYLEQVNPTQFAGAKEFHSQYNFDEPCDSEHNRELAFQSRNFYVPSGFEDRVNCLAVVNFDGELNQHDASLFAKQNRAYPAQPVVMIQIVDYPVIWTEPKDVTIDEARAIFSLAKVRKKTPYKLLLFLLNDGSCRYDDSIEDCCE